MTQKKDYPLKFLKIIAQIIKRRKESGIYSRELIQKKLDVLPKLSNKKNNQSNSKPLKVSNITIEKNKLPKKQNKYLLIPLPKKENSSKTTKKRKSLNAFNTQKNIQKSTKKSLKKPLIKTTKSKNNNKNNKNKNSQNIVTLEPYINAQPKKVTLSLDGVKQDSNTNKSEIPIKYPLEKIVQNELESPIKNSKTKVKSQSKAKSQSKVKSKNQKKTKTKKIKSLNLKSHTKPNKKTLKKKSKLSNKQELLSKIKTLEDWISKVKGTVNDKSLKNLEEKLSYLKNKVSKIK